MKKATTLLLLAAAILTGCSGFSGRYSNITTSGSVFGPNGEPVQNIVILIQSNDFAINDSTITDESGRFYRATKHVPYPFPKVKVIAIDRNEVLQPYALENKYLSDTLTTGYMFECGTNAPPVEKDWAFNSEELNFHLIPLNETAGSLEQTSAWLLGKWFLIKETMTNGDGFGGVAVSEGEELYKLEEYRFDEEKMYYDCVYSYSYYHTTDTFDYSLQTQTEGKWLLTANGRFDQEPNSTGGFSPITIHKLTTNYLEWEFESYGGDEGPVNYYQCLEKQE